MRRLIERENSYTMGNVFDDVKDTLGPQADKALDFLAEQSEKVPEEAQESFEAAVKRNPLGMMLFAAAGGAIGGQVLRSWAGVLGVGALGLWIGTTVLDTRREKVFDPNKSPDKVPSTPKAPPLSKEDELVTRLRDALKQGQLPR